MLILVVAGVLGFIMAFSIGANDVANSMATAVGARAITVKQASLIAMLLEFLGAVMFGSHVSQTIVKGIVEIERIQPVELMYGSLSALIAASLWILVATNWGYPVSTTHSIVGGMLGFGIVAAGFNGINWKVFFFIVLSWIVSPLLGGALSFVVFKLISFTIFHTKNPKRSSIFAVPFFISLAIFTMASLFVKKTLKQPLSESLILGVILAVVTFISLHLIVKRLLRNSKNEYDVVENVFKRAQILTSCYVSFSHGANDVANAAGPIAAVMIVASTGVIPKTVEIPFLALALGGIGISMGVFFLGQKVMETVGEKITTLTNSRGFTVDFSAATTVLLASSLGLPVSTTHVVVGAVTGVGLARGIEVVNVGVLKNIVISWFLIVPTVAATSAGVYSILKLVLKF
ncbi:inorganic phosphate transporter [Thermotoga sp. SG1]|uniref:inorganic phosphate transporter n=1 Tax=Thermotoga sp. SG1 TaxID=126739 RepID=UPI000C760452|nr:inorganic phosphate transporter [Thermotoga sp. SG1]PLV57467.1 phosphate permease [Thermotoga sp. SG1]